MTWWLRRAGPIARGTSGEGEVVDPVHLQQQRLADVVTQQLEASRVHQVTDIVAHAREEVVEADDIVALLYQTLAEMRADESGAAGNQHPHVLSRPLR